jgi:hypothetical protein
MAGGRNHYWYVLQEGLQSGPMSLSELREAIIKRAVVAGARFRRGDAETYVPGPEHFEIADLFSDHGVLTTHAATPRAKKRD